MKKIVLSTLAAILIAQSGFTQTKLIFHRSHSGSNVSFSLDGPDNLGNLREPVYEKIVEHNEEDQKRLKKEEEKRQKEAQALEEAQKKEAARLAEIEKQKKAEAERQKLLEAEKNKYYVKDSAIRVNNAKVIKDTTGKTHKRQFYSPYGLPTNRSPKPEAKIQFIREKLSDSNSTKSIQADFSFAAWLLISAAALSYFMVKK